MFLFKAQKTEFTKQNKTKRTHKKHLSKTVLWKKWIGLVTILQYIQLSNIMLYVNYTSTKKDFFNCLLLSMAFKLPEGSPPSYIKKLNSTIFTASHKQSTILSISSTVSCVFKSGKRFYRFLGISAINVNLQEKKNMVFYQMAQN